MLTKKLTQIGFCLILVGALIFAAVYINREDTEDKKNLEPKKSPQDAKIRVSTEKESYDKGETVNITVSLLNNNSENVTYDFSENRRLNLSIYDCLENEVWNNSYEIPSEITVSAHSEYILIDNFSWDGKNNEEERIPNGTFQIEAILGKFNSSCNTTVEIGNYIRIVTDKDVYKKDEVVNITLILVNNKNETVTYWFPALNTNRNVSIYDSSGNEVWRDPYCIHFGMITNVTLPPCSELVIGNLSWTHFDRLMVEFTDEEHYENASSIIRKHNGTIIKKIPSINVVVVNVHENHTETFIEEIQKEKGVKFAEPDTYVVLNRIPVDIGKYRIRANLCYNDDIFGEKYIQIEGA